MPKLKEKLYAERERLMNILMDKDLDPKIRAYTELSLQSINAIIQCCVERNRF